MIGSDYQWAERRQAEGGKKGTEYYVKLYREKCDQREKMLTEKGLVHGSLLELGLIQEVTPEGRQHRLDNITTFYHWIGRLGEPAENKKEIAEFNKIPESDVDAFVANIDAQKRIWVARSFNIPQSEVGNLVEKVREILGEDYIELDQEIYS